MPSVPVTIVGVMTWSGDSGERPPSPPLGIWGGAPLPTPTPPIYYPPSPPLGIWGGGNVPMPTPPIAPGGPPPGYWGGVAPPFPTHPIAPGGPPPSVWPGPGYPAHPIAPGGPPLGFWGGVAPPFPSHPIAGAENEPPLEVKVGWTPQTGWIVVLVPSGDTTVPTPSATKVEVTKAEGQS